VVAGDTPVLVHNNNGVDDCPIQWVHEGQRYDEAGMFDAGATGARSDLATGQRLVPALPLPTRKSGLVKFDGYDPIAGVLIDRKHGMVATTKRAREQALAQSQALALHGLRAVWEVNTTHGFKRATRMLESLGITNISVRKV